VKRDRDNIVKVADLQDLPELVAYLSCPDIDHSFKKPLSEREIAIAERVKHYYEHGFWVFARIAGTIYACIAAVPSTEEQKVFLSTMAVRNCKRGKKLGNDVYEKAIKLATERYQAKYVIVDSWEGNKEVTLLLTNRGYVPIASYYDKSKRPPGIKTVEYQLELP